MADAALTIRAATFRDAAVLASFAADLALGAPPAPDGVTGALAALVGQYGVGAFLAELDGEPVGYVVVHRVPALFAGGVVAVVEEIYVVPERRGRGIGAALMERAEEASAAWEVAYVCVATSRAVDFYKALGYEPTARFLKKGLD
ncbi:GNAT family N-acetyltransferase [Demequina sp. SYSU T00192]|uniref:GNAT family N-acetyltransferase n=1 Tax=Demequina litoralis TaxID=3051660 RepID=A0ABT8G9S7_9MICO|nr:GNAT family N-acetyltransferase [Demequina sp. SYSU T00192]MDN4475889.1 GNAT family N-acetyltransferase [Demequina sp. SYSU T00192]